MAKSTHETESRTRLVNRNEGVKLAAKIVDLLAEQTPERQTAILNFVRDMLDINVERPTLEEP